MSLTKKIAHNTIVQIAGKLISTFLGLLMLGMMTHYLGAEKFGWYITTIAFLQFIGILTDFGTIVVTAQMISEPFHNKEKLLNNIFTLRLTTSLFFLGLAPFIAMFFPYPVEVKIAIAFTTISFLAMAINQVFTGLYQARLRMHVQAIGEVIGRLVGLVGLWFLIKQNSDFLTIMTITLVPSVLYTAYVWLDARKDTRISLAFDFQLWKKIISKMWPIAISIIFNVVYLKGDLIILTFHATQAEVGIYGAAYRVLDVITQSAMMIMGVLLPLLAFHWSRKEKHEFKKRYQQSFDIMMLFAIPATIGTITVSDKIMRFIASEQFAQSGQILSILSLAIFGVFLGAIFGHTAVAIDKQKQTIWIYLSDAIITLIGYIFFIPKFGMYGAAWMSVFSELYAGILLFFVIQKYCQEKIHLATSFKILFSSLIMSFVLTLIPQVHVLFTVPIGIIVFGSVLLFIGGISKETLREITRR